MGRRGEVGRIYMRLTVSLVVSNSLVTICINSIHKRVRNFTMLHMVGTMSYLYVLVLF